MPCDEMCLPSRVIRMKQQAKLVASLSLVIVFFIITTVLVPIDSDDWQNTFFAVTMVMVVILNGGCHSRRPAAHWCARSMGVGTHRGVA